MLSPDKTLGKNIAYYRKELNLTKEKLAVITGLWPGYLSDVETGRKVPRIDTIARLAAELRVTIDELVGIP